jgi:hypothetical protein
LGKVYRGEPTGGMIPTNPVWRIAYHVLIGETSRKEDSNSS